MPQSGKVQYQILHESFAKTAFLNFFTQPFRIRIRESDRPPERTRVRAQHRRLPDRAAGPVCLPAPDAEADLRAGRLTEASDTRYRPRG